MFSIHVEFKPWTLKVNEVSQVFSEDIMLFDTLLMASTVFWRF